jgi:hypothetical protein
VSKAVSDLVVAPDKHIDENAFFRFVNFFYEGGKKAFSVNEQGDILFGHSKDPFLKTS